PLLKQLLCNGDCFTVKRLAIVEPALASAKIPKLTDSCRVFESPIDIVRFGVEQPALNVEGICETRLDFGHRAEDPGHGPFSPRVSQSNGIAISIRMFLAKRLQNLDRFFVFRASRLKPGGVFEQPGVGSQTVGVLSPNGCVRRRLREKALE